MKQFLVEYSQSGSAELRDKNRPAHIAYRSGLGATLLLAGPMLDESGTSIGSLVIIEADNEEMARSIASKDPFVGAGVLSVQRLQLIRVAYMKAPPPGAATS